MNELAGTALGRALAAAAAARPLLVATDFDGVLAPFEIDPMAVRPTAGVMTDLQALSELPGVAVAIVSGRDLATLAALTGRADDRITLIASHGAQSSRRAVQDAMEAAAVTPDGDERLQRLRDELGRLADEHPGARVEVKSAGVVLHTRGLPEPVAAAALQAAAELGAARPDVRVLRGKAVVELSISPADKGTALVALARHVGAQARLYVGDDVTDEDVFLALTDPGDVTVKVGPGETAARYRVADTEAVADLVATVHRLARGVP